MAPIAQRLQHINRCHTAAALKVSAQIPRLLETKAMLQLVLLFPHAADDTIAEELVEWFQAEVCEQSNSCSDETPEYGTSVSRIETVAS